jgi:hypothetical protein
MFNLNVTRCLCYCLRRSVKYKLRFLALFWRFSSNVTSCCCCCCCLSEELLEPKCLSSQESVWVTGFLVLKQQLVFSRRRARYSSSERGHISAAYTCSPDNFPSLLLLPPTTPSLTTVSPFLSYLTIIPSSLYRLLLLWQLSFPPKPFSSYLRTTPPRTTNSSDAYPVPVPPLFTLVSSSFLLAIRSCSCLPASPVLPAIYFCPTYSNSYSCPPRRI